MRPDVFPVLGWRSPREELPTDQPGLGTFSCRHWSISTKIAGSYTSNSAVKIGSRGTWSADCDRNRSPSRRPDLRPACAGPAPARVVLLAPAGIHSRTPRNPASAVDIIVGAGSPASCRYRARLSSFRKPSGRPPRGEQLFHSGVEFFATPCCRGDTGLSASIGWRCYGTAPAGDERTSSRQARRDARKIRGLGGRASRRRPSRDAAADAARDHRPARSARPDVAGAVLPGALHSGRGAGAGQDLDDLQPGPAACRCASTACSSRPT